jgi:hypothetical protein
MDLCARKLKRSGIAPRDDVRIPAVGLVRTPQIEHALGTAHGKIPGEEMNQSWAAIAWPNFCVLFCHRLNGSSRKGAKRYRVSKVFFASLRLA